MWSCNAVRTFAEIESSSIMVIELDSTTANLIRHVIKVSTNTSLKLWSCSNYICMYISGFSLEHKWWYILIFWGFWKKKKWYSWLACAKVSVLVSTRMPRVGQNHGLKNNNNICHRPNWKKKFIIAKPILAKPQNKM